MIAKLPPFVPIFIRACGWLVLFHYAGPGITAGLALLWIGFELNRIHDKHRLYMDVYIKVLETFQLAQDIAASDNPSIQELKDALTENLDHWSQSHEKE